MKATARSSYFAAPGKRAYYATRTLLQNRFQVRSISGGLLARSQHAGD